jgi:hypothetical protein
VHQGLELSPDDFELIGVGRQGPPEGRHEVDLLRPLDVVKNFANFAADAVLIGQTHRGLAHWL